MKKGDECSSITGIHLQEALELGGCPICRLVENAENEEIKSFLYEYVNDSMVRDKIRRRLGFCPFHSWLLFRTALKPEISGQLGIAILYEDLIKTYAELLEEGDMKNLVNVNKEECLICKVAKETETTYLELFARCYETSERFRRLYESSKAILCRRHLLKVLEIIKDEKVKVMLIKQQTLKLKDIGRRLRSFIDKHDYRNKELITKEELRAISEAVETLSGGYNSMTLCQREGEKKVVSKRFTDKLFKLR